MGPNKFSIIPDRNEPLLLHFVLDGRECLNGVFLETLIDKPRVWVPCVFYIDADTAAALIEDSPAKPSVVIWLATEQGGAVAAQIVGDPLDAFYRWPIASKGGRA